MSHPEYPDLPELLYKLAKIIRPAEWDEKVWRGQPERWAKNVRWRQWSIETARKILDFLMHPPQSMIAAGARVLEGEYETDTARRDVDRIFKAMIKSAFTRAGDG